jgi:hypothetical protein
MLNKFVITAYFHALLDLSPAFYTAGEGRITTEMSWNSTNARGTLGTRVFFFGAANNLQLFWVFTLLI